jgi:hypothetical protein
MGPSLGRTTGVDAEQPVSHAHHHHGGGGGAGPASPGYPQDMFMAMDDEVAKPETHGLRPSWTGGMMGMMTLLRVLHPEKYEEILALKAGARGDGR